MHIAPFHQANGVPRLSSVAKAATCVGSSAMSRPPDLRRADAAGPGTKYHPETISRMLRRRFSRESKDSSAHHEPSKFLFPFPRKSSRSGSKATTELTALGDYGSSLMSESRYDSDAQFISTPQRDLMDSPASRGRRRMELSNLIEQSHENGESERWAIGHGDNIPEPPVSAFGMHFIHTPPSSMRSQRSPYHKVHDAAFVEGERKHEHSIKLNLARSLPNLNSISQGCRGPISVPPHAPHFSGGPNDQKHSRDCQSMGISNHNYGVAASGSLPNQSSGMMVAKSRQQAASSTPLTGTQTVHLEDKGMSHRFAPQCASSGPMSCNLSIDDLIRNDRYGAFMNASQETMPASPRSATSIACGHDPRTQIYHQRDGSSYYSHRPNPISANASRAHSPALDVEKHIGIGSRSTFKLTAEDANLHHGSPQTNGMLSSKFEEHCDNGSPEAQVHLESNDIHGIGSPRKVSAGWMSGGRRVGYGYSPVPNDEAVQHTQHCDSHSPVRPCSTQKTEPVIHDANLQRGHAGQSHGGRTDHVYAAEPTIPETKSTPVNHHSNRPEVGRATVPRARNPTRTINDYPEPPYLRDILSGRYSEEHDRESVISDERGTGSLRAAKVPPKSQAEHCQVPQSSHHVSRPADTPLHRWARLSQSMKANPLTVKDQKGRRSGIRGVIQPKKGQQVPNSGDNAVDIDPDYLGIEHDLTGGDVAHLLRPSNSRGAKWVRRLSKHKESTWHSNVHQQEISQASSGPYLDCDHNDLERANSTKSTLAEDFANMYQGCLDMPGSFEGSRWANRTSRMLWDLVTTDDDQ
ncbi:uncharacterized protein N7482_002125 [Penicillium canariense]|uniref:Uncharacterized protein n=1 Tax=Penicillium canariense TaxID=189055 RepID=A0A9W9IGE9_9EURO|nr:uncharacterized protein N7482_002125 [Penicillium canariense]KAJ5176248.1 hypothetical protein N7482_002125 [Penicillium canariense]